MTISKTPIDGLLILEPKKFGDDRGYFFESFNQEVFDEATSEKYEFVQDNQSFSQKGVLRGLHFQKPPFAQGKLVRVIQGRVLDIAVDIRKESTTYGQYYAIELSEKNNLQFWVPPGFAHGFLTLEDDTIFSYKCTNYYSPENEGAIIWNDQDININWKEIPSMISEKDKVAQEFRNFVTCF